MALLKPLDLNRLAQKEADLKNPKKRYPDQRQPSRKWNPPKDGEASIRIIQYPFGTDPFVDLWMHYGIENAKSGIVCPKYNTQFSSNNECPVCELADALRKTRQDEDWKLFTRIQAKQRFFAVVVDRADTSLTPKYWGFGVKVYQDFIAKLTKVDGDYANFLDLDAGKDLLVKLVKTEGKTYAETSVEFRVRDTPLAPTADQRQQVINNIVPIEQVYTVLSAPEIQKILDEWQSVGADQAEKLSGEATRGAADSTSDTVPLDNVDRAFNEADLG
jgi:hypothetical protein